MLLETKFLKSCCVGAPTPPSGSVICQEDFQDSAHSPAHGCDLFRWKGARPAAEGRGAWARAEEARSTCPASSPESHRMALVPPCVKCPPGKLIRDSLPRHFPGGWAHTQLHVPKLQTPEGRQVFSTSHVVCTVSLSYQSGAGNHLQVPRPQPRAQLANQPF